MSQSRACFCASSVAMFFGLVIAMVGFVILVGMAVEKKVNEDAAASTTPRPGSAPFPNNQPGRPGQPMYPNLPGQPGNNQPNSNNNKPLLKTEGLFSTENADFFILLSLIFGAGLGITILGFICSNCAILCCTGKGGSIEPSSEVKDWQIES